MESSFFAFDQPVAVIAPSKRLKFSSLTTKSGSIFGSAPKPSQCGHAPIGLLNENIRGASSCRLMPQSSHAKFWLNDIISPSITSTHTKSPVREIAVSSESVRRCCALSRITIRSTTISISCFCVFLSSISSPRSYIIPSALTRT